MTDSHIGDANDADSYFIHFWFRSRKEITLTSSRFSRMPLCLPVRYIPSGMRLTGNSQNLFGIFRGTCQVYFLTAPNLILLISLIWNLTTAAQRNPFYPRMALISTNKTEALAVSLILWRKIKFTAKYSFVFIRVISGQTFPLLSFVSYLIKLRVPQSNADFWLPAVDSCISSVFSQF